MEKLLKQIKYNRVYGRLEHILKMCQMHSNGSSYIIKMNSTTFTTAFCVFEDEIDYLDYGMFLKFGMNETITEDELLKILYERFKYNKI